MSRDCHNPVELIFNEYGNKAAGIIRDPYRNMSWNYAWVASSCPEYSNFADEDA